jgi:hypothetical protein
LARLASIMACAWAFARASTVALTSTFWANVVSLN